MYLFNSHDWGSHTPTLVHYRLPGSCHHAHHGFGENCPFLKAEVGKGREKKFFFLKTPTLLNCLFISIAEIPNHVTDL